MTRRLRPYLELARPPNLLTAAADVLAGFAAAAALAEPAALPWLLGASVCLYGGGVTLNDAFDAPLDAAERPERPIPSGRVSRRAAALQGGLLLAAGIGLAAGAGPVSAALAGGIAAAALLYNAGGKRVPGFGPLNMGACRGLNLLLGLSASPALLAVRWQLALVPLAYVAAITAVSRGEVAGATRGAGVAALALLGGVLGALLGFAALLPAFDLLALLPFLAFFAWRVLPPFWRAYRQPEPAAARAAVKAGVLALIPLNAALAAGFAGPLYGLAVLALLPLAALLARAFSVT